MRREGRERQLQGQETLDMRREESRFELACRLTPSLRDYRLTPPFPIRAACEAGAFVYREGGIRDLAGGGSP